MSCLTDPAGADPTGTKGNTIMTSVGHVVGGIDSHHDTIYVAVVTNLGREVADREFPTTGAGYRAAVTWLSSHGALANGRLVTVLRDDPLFELANHGDRHVPVSVTGAAAYGIPGTADAGEVYDEIAGAHRLFRWLWGVQSRWFRPGTAHTDDVSARIAIEMGTPVVGFTVNADMGATASAEQVRTALLGFAPGGIALAHMNQPGSGTAAGVAAAVPLLRARGLRFRRLEDALV